MGRLPVRSVGAITTLLLLGVAGSRGRATPPAPGDPAGTGPGSDPTSAVAGLAIEGDIRMVDGRLVVERGHARASLRDLRRLLGDRLPGGLTARGQVVLTLHGPLRDLRIGGGGTLRDLTFSGVRVGRARVSLELTGVPGAPRGRIRVRGEDVTAGGVALGPIDMTAELEDRGQRIALDLTAGDRERPVQLSASAVVLLRGPRTRIELGRVSLRTRELVWRGRGGTVDLGPGARLAIRGVALASDAGRVALVGSVAGRDLRRATGEVAVQVDDLDLDRTLTAIAPGRVPGLALAGTVSLTAKLARQRREVTGELAATARDLAWRADMPPLAARVQVDLEAGRLTAELGVDTPTGGAASLRASVDTPRDPLSPAAWRGRGLADLRSAELRVTGVRLDAAWAALGARPPLGGVVGGAVTLPEGSREVQLSVELDDGSLSGVTGLSAAVRGSWDANRLAAEVDIAHAGARLLEGRLELAAGLPAVLRRGLAAIRPAAIAGRLQAPAIPLALVRRVGGFRARASGTLRATIDLGGTVSLPVVAVDASSRRLQLASVTLVDVTAGGRLEPGRIEAAVRARQPAGGGLAAEARLGRARPLPLEAHLEARRLDLAFVRAFAGPRSTLATVAGSLDADLDVEGTAAAPRFEGTLRLRGGRIAPPVVAVGPLADIEADVRLQDERIVLERLAARAGDGRIRAHGSAVLAGGVPAQLAVSVATEDVPVLLAGQVASVTVKARLSGGRTSAADAAAPAGTWDLRADVEGGTIRLPQAGGPRLQRVGPLADYVYVDEEAQRVAGAAPQVRIRVLAERGLRARSVDLDALVAADLEVEVSRAGIAVEGSAAVRRGSLVIVSRRYDIVHARAAFGGEIPPDPQLDVLLRHEFRNLTLDIAVTGSLREPRLALRSDRGGYDETQLLAIVLGGNPEEPQEAARPLGGRAVGLASNLLLTRLRRRFTRLLRVDVLRLELGGAGGLGPSELQVGRFLTENLLLRFVYRPEAPEDFNTSEALLEYRFGLRWMFEATYGNRGVGNLDVLWTRRF